MDDFPEVTGAPGIDRLMHTWNTQLDGLISDGEETVPAVRSMFLSAIASEVNVHGPRATAELLEGFATSLREDLRLATN